MQQLTLSCYTCGRGLKTKPRRPPCEELNGWITVSFWKGKGLVEHGNFCSTGCLYNFLLNHITPVPDVFLQSFGEDN